MPPNEWPMMIGGWSSSETMLPMCETISGTVCSAITDGFSRSASTSISKPG